MSKKTVDELLSDIRILEMKDAYRWAHIYNNRHIDDMAYAMEMLCRHLNEVVSSKFWEDVERFQRIRRQIEADEEYTTQPFTGVKK